MSNEATGLAWHVLESGVLTMGEGLVLLRLADFADDRWSSFPSQDLLELMTNQKERSVRSHLARLRELDLVRTEDRRNAAGYRTGLRFYLNQERLEEIKKDTQAIRPARLDEKKAEKKALSDRKRGVETAGENRENSVPANNAGRAQNPGNSVPANFAGRSENRENPVPADFAGRGSLPAKSCTNSESAFKGNARGFNHQQQQPREDADVVDESTPTTSIDPLSLIVGWQTGVDDEMELIHRGVDVVALAGAGNMFGQQHDVAVWHRVIDLVLDRASGSVRIPHAYVVAAFTSSARPLMLEAVKSLEAPKAPQQAARAVGTLECAKHSWSGRESAMCPSCRADALAGEPTEGEAAALLTEEQISKLPEAYRHMARPGFTAPKPDTHFLETGTESDDVAPWDRERVSN